jgi:hypothetical protein
VISLYPSTNFSRSQYLFHLPFPRYCQLTLIGFEKGHTIMVTNPSSIYFNLFTLFDKGRVVEITDCDIIARKVRLSNGIVVS